MDLWLVRLEWEEDGARRDAGGEFAAEDWRAAINDAQQWHGVQNTELVRVDAELLQQGENDDEAQAAEGGDP